MFNARTKLQNISKIQVLRHKNSKLWNKIYAKGGTYIWRDHYEAISKPTNNFDIM
jgi:hypothetical protein